MCRLRVWDTILQHCADELIPGKYIQTAEVMQQQLDEMFRKMNEMMSGLLDRLAAKD